MSVVDDAKDAVVRAYKADVMTRAFWVVVAFVVARAYKGRR